MFLQKSSAEAHISSVTVGDMIEAKVTLIETRLL